MTGRLLAALLVVTLIFRCWLAAAFPITGDEAYFIWWGWKPDWGFYDHPPMIGWWLAALLMLHDAEWWLRLPVIVQPAVLALTVYFSLPRLIAGIGDERRVESELCREAEDDRAEIEVAVGYVDGEDALWRTQMRRVELEGLQGQEVHGDGVIAECVHREHVVRAERAALALRFEDKPAVPDARFRPFAM